VVGAAKAGTTSLWRYLGDHPEIFMSPLKEPFFFAQRRFGSPVTDSAAYLRLFASADERLRGEASSTYLWEEGAPAAIQAASPAAAIVISLREPVDLTRSLYLHMVRLGLERRTFAQAIADEVVHGRVPSRLPLPYVRPGLYSPGVERYLERFGGRVFVAFFEDLVADAPATMRALFEFLGVEPSFAERLDARPHNEFALPRAGVVGRLMRSRRAWAVGYAVVPRPARDRLYRTLVRSAPKPEPEPEAVDMLRRVYEPDVAALRGLLRRELPEAWRRRFPAGA
jgi:hypothetical protein